MVPGAGEYANVGPTRRGQTRYLGIAGAGLVSSPSGFFEPDIAYSVVKQVLCHASSQAFMAVAVRSGEETNQPGVDVPADPL